MPTLCLAEALGVAIAVGFACTREGESQIPIESEADAGPVSVSQRYSNSLPCKGCFFFCTHCGCWLG